MTGHAGILRRIGWVIDGDTGKEVFRATIDYPNGPPGKDLPFDVVWKSLPVKIVVIDSVGSETERGK